jgi:hypothetical protein
MTHHPARGQLGDARGLADSGGTDEGNAPATVK